MHTYNTLPKSVAKFYKCTQAFTNVSQIVHEPLYTLYVANNGTFGKSWLARR